MNLRNLSRKRVFLIMIGVMMSVFLGALDSTIVGTAMPKMINDLQGMEHYTWPFTVYMLCSTTAIPIFGKLADIYGRKLIYFIGISVFLLASMLCGLSQDMLQLILFRGLQGIGGGILISNAFAIVGDIFTPLERGKYQGLVAAMFGLASVIGPALGGYITDNLTWRWVFYVNLPVGLVTILVMTVALPNIRDHAVKRVIDFAGVITLILALVPMLLAFSWAGREYSWQSPEIIGLLSFAAVMFILFGWVEKRAVEPIVPLSLFQNSIFNVSVIASFLSNAAMFTTVIFIPLFVQGVIGSNATQSGMVTMPMTVSLVIGSIISGQLISRTGRYKVLGISGFLISLVGMIFLARMNVQTTNSQVVWYMIISGFGLGVNMPIFNITVQNAFPHSQLGLVTSVVQFFRNIGGTISSAILGSVMISSMNRQFSQMALTNMPSSIKGVLASPQALVNPDNISKIKASLPSEMIPVFEQMMNQVKGVLASAIQQTFLIGVLILIAAVITAFFLKEVPLLSEESKEENDQPWLEPQLAEK